MHFIMGRSRICFSWGCFFRTLVISSSCKNGPKEILLNGDGGYIFKSNDKNDFLKQFDNLMEEHNNDPDTIYKKS